MDDCADHARARGGGNGISYQLCQHSDGEIYDQGGGGVTFDIHWVDHNHETHTLYITTHLWRPLGQFIAQNVVLPYQEHEGLQSNEGVSFCPESLGKIARFLRNVIASSDFETISSEQRAALVEFHNICANAVWVGIS